MKGSGWDCHIRCAHVEIKFVIADQRDLDWSCQQVRVGRLAERFGILFSPVFGELAPQTLAAWVLEWNLPARLQIQLHKHIWGPAARGV
jgi:7-carboxy-7-deazaguanine synthase